MILVALVALVAPATRAIEAPQGPAIRMVEGSAFEVVGLDSRSLGQFASADLDREAWAELFAVRVEKAEAPMLGSHRVEEGILRFEPRFPLQPGLRYRAIFQPASMPGGDPSAPPITAEYAIPKPPTGPATKVVSVYPSGDVLPENLLRFYLHFSGPMSQGEAYDHVRLLGPDGEEVDRPFLELGQELWDPSGIRLTLLIDPGRIKSGLEPREIFGPVLEEGNRYSLVIDDDWPDALGNPLAAPYRKTFLAGAPESDPIDPKSWTLKGPEAGTTEALTLTFPRPLDHAMLERVIRVVGPDDRRISGTIQIKGEEDRWEFTPKDAWEAGDYQLLIDKALEDRTGNNIGQAFEVDVFERVDRDATPGLATIPFRVGPDR